MDKTVIELFAGVGGFRVGLNHITGFDENGRAIEDYENKWDFVWANQWEPSTKVQHAYDCYTTRFGKEHASNQDISTVDKESIPDHSLLVGGFPCQDYSVARSLSGSKGIEGKKGVLFWSIAEILEKKKTPFALLENVDRLLKSPAKQRGRDFGIMLRTLHDLGYNVEWRVINAADYGAPQRRRRTFIFIWKRDSKYNELIKSEKPEKILLEDGLFAKCFKVEKTLDKIKYIDITEPKDTVEMTESFHADFRKAGVMLDGQVICGDPTPITIPSKTLREICISEQVDETYFLTESQKSKFKELRDKKKKQRTAPDGTEYTYSEGAMEYPDSLDKPGRTMLTSEKSVNRSTHVIHDIKTNNDRFLTPIEAERLQTFPDNWTNTGMPERRRFFMMGNALVCDVIKTLEPELSKIIENE